MAAADVTIEEYRGAAAWFSAYADGFRDASGALPGPLKFKLAHSGRVASNAARIASGLGLAGGELELARAGGLLHDTGRFGQYKKFLSFIDARSLDHGEEGWRVLGSLAAGLFRDRAAMDRLLCAVRYHNRKAEDLPKGLPPGHESLLCLVRDADKLDILDELVSSLEEDGFTRLSGMLPDIKIVKELTPGVLEAAARGETLSLKELRTVADIIVMAAAWFYDLNYGPARRLGAERGFLERLRRQLPPSADRDRFFAGVTAAAALPGRSYVV